MDLGSFVGFFVIICLLGRWSCCWVCWFGARGEDGGAACTVCRGVAAGRNKDSCQFMLGSFRYRQGRGEGGSNVRCGHERSDALETVRPRGVRYDRFQGKGRRRYEGGNGVFNRVVNCKRDNRYAAYRRRLFACLSGLCRLNEVVVRVRRVPYFLNDLYATVRNGPRVDLNGNEDVVYSIARRNGRFTNDLLFLSVLRLVF